MSTYNKTPKHILLSPPGTPSQGEPRGGFQPFLATCSLASPHGTDPSEPHSHRGNTTAGMCTWIPLAALSQPGGRGWP